MNISILEISSRLVSNIKTDFIRSSYFKIPWNERLVGVIGPRGIGKTTILLQHLKQNPSTKKVYFSADHFAILANGLYQTVESLYKEESKSIFYIDEIHKYSSWNQELKNIYDTFPNIQIYFSGSSSINLIKGGYDLSRRAILYKLQGLSFREYLEYNLKEKFPIFSLSEILTPHSKPAHILYEKLGEDILFHFKKYLQTGYYPFSFENKNKEIFHEKLKNTLEKFLYEDISSFYSLKTQNIEKIKKIILFYAFAMPSNMSIHALSKKISVSYDTAVSYLQMLYEGGIIRSIFPEGGISKMVRKSKKIYLDNTNILYAMKYDVGKDIQKGMIREIFFLNQTQESSNVSWSNKSDFICKIKDKNIVVEIGGKSKTKKQIKDIDNSFLIKDDIFIPSQKEIPLWIFGFLY